ncbi:MAG: alanine racemase [Spirochaetaceae bacterium]|nr:alanine racemase [Spirochaetaceae bacterium]
MRATQAIIHLENLTFNIHAVKKHIAGSGGGPPVPKICMPVKADAYGHGAVEIAKTALEAGCSHLAVATVDEGAQLRAAGIKAPILLFSEATPEELETVARLNLIPFVSDREYAALYASYAEKAGKNEKHGVFLKVDSGMGRLGCAPEEAAPLAQFISGQKALSLAGTATHCAVSDSRDAGNKAFTARQLAVFKGVIDEIKKCGVNPGIVSAANTGATVSYPQAHFDMVRPGILLYGYQDEEVEPPLAVKPVMELVTQVVHIKKIRKGGTVSYGRTWTAPEDTFIGVLPLGYADGLPRLLSGRDFYVVINGRQYPLAGRICMDQCMINLGATPAVKRYDAVTVFGGEKPAFDAAAIAKRIGTISYEICCGVNKRVPRVYTATPRLS